MTDRSNSPSVWPGALLVLGSLVVAGAGAFALRASEWRSSGTLQAAVILLGIITGLGVIVGLGIASSGLGNRRKR